MFPRLRNYFISGLVVCLPIAGSIYIVVSLINFADGLLGKFLEPYMAEKFGFYFQGLSILVGVYLIMLVGMLATNFLGKKIHHVFENIILKLPFFKQIYPAIKEIALFLFSREKLSFKQVVVIEYPRKGLYSFGFLTNETNDKIRKLVGKDLCNVFIPSAPGPFTGYVMMVPRKDIMMTDLSVEQAIKFIVSGGVVNPYLA